MKISEFCLLSLWVIKHHGEIQPKHFAIHMWPNSPAWKHVSNTGHGATTGKGMWLSAGSYLSRLMNNGLVTQGWDDIWSYQLTFKGQDVLKNNEIRIKKLLQSCIGGKLKGIYIIDTGKIKNGLVNTGFEEE